jgi:GTP cyclohydrolase I
MASTNLKSRNKKCPQCSSSPEKVADPVNEEFFRESPGYFALQMAYKEVLNLPEIRNAIAKDHLEKTPIRAAKALNELLSGYGQNPEEVLQVGFSKKQYDQMVTVGDIKFSSLCSHHILPFIGKAYFAYIPSHHVVGLSKIPRMIEIFSRRLQVQENLTDEIVDCFQKVVKPRGCAVLLQAEHMCLRLRGAKKEESWMRTTAFRGIFNTDPPAKAEFLDGIFRK